MACVSVSSLPDFEISIKSIARKVLKEKLEYVDSCANVESAMKK